MVALAVREVMDLICKRVDAIEISYSEKDEREHHRSQEDLKILAVHPLWLEYLITGRLRTPSLVIGRRPSTESC
jgi:hypothetical protein